MRVYFVGAGPGDPDLLTVKGREILARCAVVIHAGSLVNPVLLKFARPGAEIHDSARMTHEQLESVIRAARDAGQDVVRLHSGDPAIYGALGEHLEIAAALGVECEVIPGVSSFTAAAARMAQELTVPEVAQTVILTRAGGRTKVPEPETLASLAAHRATLVLFLSADLMEQVEADLLKGYPPETPVAIAHRATWPDERYVPCELRDLSATMRREKIDRTALIFVGPFLDAGHRRSRLYDKAFSHMFRRAERPATPA